MLWLDQKNSLRALPRVEDLRLDTCHLKPALLTAMGWLEMHADVTFQQLSVQAVNLNTFKLAALPCQNERQDR